VEGFAVEFPVVATGKSGSSYQNELIPVNWFMVSKLAIPAIPDGNLISPFS
jgi:hypothetical protein